MRVGYIIPAGREMSAEERAGWDFLTSRKRATSKRLRVDRLPPIEDLRRSFDILWWHSDESPAIESAVLPSALAVLKQFVERGGSLFLSLLPASLPVALGYEQNSPASVHKGVWEEESWARGYPDIRGFASYRGHPVFHGMTGGLYSWMPEKGSPYSGVRYENELPSAAKIIAVERQYIKVIPSRRIAWEYPLPKGRILCVGTYLFFTEQASRVRPHLEQFTANCLTHLTASRRRAERTNYWSFEGGPPIPIDRNSVPLTVRSHLGDLPETHPTIHRTHTAGSRGEAFDVGGRRCVIVGDERTGVREVWFHPVRGLQNVRLGLQDAEGQLTWLEESDSDIDIRPDAFIRRTVVSGTACTDVTFSHPTSPVGAVSVRTSGGSVRLVVTAEIDLRLMWPLDEHATGALTYAWDIGLQAAVVSVASGEIAAIVGSSVRPTTSFVGNCEKLDVRLDGSFAPEGVSGRLVRVGFSVDLDAATPAVTLAFAGSTASEREAELAYREMMEDPAAVLSKQTLTVDHVMSGMTMLHASDAAFTDAYSWALVGTDRFYMTTPGIGTSYVAGFGTVDRGWDGGHEVSGRPGYAWYFGRDAVWTAFAALATGDFDKVRGVLEFLGKHQDVTGKILHELTTSGYAHYDAADATPLYIMLMGRYVRASGHRSFARGEFPKVRKALDFCYSTDTDGDGLIENTNVGHGWVEGGGLFPIHTEHYLASCWSAALAEASFLAGVTDHPQLSKRWQSDAERVRSTVMEEFWVDEKGYYAFGKNADGTYNDEQTLLPAVGLYLGIGEGERAERTLAPFSESEFTTDWGVRIIGSRNPMFKPTGYHYGSVWPLFTGWAALAEFRHDRPLQAFLHAVSTAMTHPHHAAGFIEEVLRGDVFEPAGVCHHQAWSESMVVQPLTEGMLGIESNGFEHTLRLSPWIPPHWSVFKATRIRVGQSWVTIEVDRGEHTTGVLLTLEGRQPVTVDLRLRFPLGTRLMSVEVNGERRPVDRTLRAYGQTPAVSARVTATTRIVYAHSGGIGLAPPLPSLTPGAASAGIRIIEESFRNGHYTLVFEGVSGSSYDLEIIHRGGRLSVHEGADLLETYVGRSKVRVTFGGDEGYTRKTIRLA